MIISLITVTSSHLILSVIEVVGFLWFFHFIPSLKNPFITWFYSVSYVSKLFLCHFHPYPNYQKKCIKLFPEIGRPRRTTHYQTDCPLDWTLPTRPSPGFPAGWQRPSEAKPWFPSLGTKTGTCIVRLGVSAPLSLRFSSLIETTSSRHGTWYRPVQE